MSDVLSAEHRRIREGYALRRLALRRAIRDLRQRWLAWLA
jgi:hypothetical protein